LHYKSQSALYNTHWNISIDNDINKEIWDESEFIYIHILSYILWFVFDVFREQCLPLLSPKKHIVSIYFAMRWIWAYNYKFPVLKCISLFSCNREIILLIEKYHSYDIHILTLFSIIVLYNKCIRAVFCILSSDN
jgi:hypothetical protein